MDISRYEMQQDKAAKRGDAFEDAVHREMLKMDNGEVAQEIIDGNGIDEGAWEIIEMVLTAIDNEPFSHGLNYAPICVDIKRTREIASKARRREAESIVDAMDMLP